MLKKYYYSCVMLNAFRYHYSQNYAGIIRPTLPGECERCGSHILIAQEQLNVPRDTKLHLSRKDPSFKPTHHPAFSLFNWSFLTRAIHTIGPAWKTMLHESMDATLLKIYMTNQV